MPDVRDLVTAAAVTSLVLNTTGGATAISLHRGTLVHRAIAVWQRLTAERKLLAAKCYISEAGCTALVDDLTRRRAVVAAEHADLVEARAAEYAFHTKSLAIRDKADATFLASKREREQAEQALEKAKAILAEAERVKADTLAILQEINAPRVSPLESPDYALPAPTRWADLDPRWAVDMDSVFPPVRDRVVVEHPQDGWLRVRVPDRSTELIEIPTDLVPAWVLDLDTGNAVYAEVSVADNPTDLFVFTNWEHPHQPADTEPVTAEAGAR